MPARRLPGTPSSSQVICKRVLMEKPSLGTAGLEDNHPPDGVADTIFPCRSMTSIWQVSPTKISRSSQVSTGETGRAHVRTPVTHAHLVCRLMLEHNKTTQLVITLFITT